jgi:hypothetical protein
VETQKHIVIGEFSKQNLTNDNIRFPNIKVPHLFCMLYLERGEKMEKISGGNHFAIKTWKLSS